MKTLKYPKNSHSPPAFVRGALLLSLLLLPAQSHPPPEVAPQEFDLNRKTTLQYGVEWRMIRAGFTRVTWTPDKGAYQGDLHVESAGMVSKLYRVNDDYRVQMGSSLCASSVHIKAQEGKRSRETEVSFDGTTGKAKYLERDLLKNAVVLEKETPMPPCVHDYIGGLNKLRTLKLDLGQSAQVPMSDGKKFASVKVEAQEREQVKTPLGTYPAVRYEIHMFNNVLINKKARMFVWLTDDARRLPVQIRVRMQFLIGTITLQLEKEERN